MRLPDRWDGPDRRNRCNRFDRRNRCRKWNRRVLALCVIVMQRTPERERERDTRGTERMPHHQAGLRRPDKQHAVLCEPCIEQAYYAILRIAIEIDQHVAAKDKVETRVS